MAQRTAIPSEFPVFPLSGALLLPHGRLPLNIFEQRYLRMVDDALASGRVIGMVQPDPARGETPSGPALYRVGCVGRISSFSETEDGRYSIALDGASRFWIQVELEMQRGYRRVRADLQRFEADWTEAAPAGMDRKRLLGALKAYFGSQGFEANWEAIEDMEDTALVTTLSMACPFEPPEKQALLEAPDTAERARTLAALLQMGAHEADVGDGGRRMS